MYKRWFQKHQKLLLNLVNTRDGRQLLGVKKNYPIVKVTPNSYHQLVNYIGNKPILQATFFTSDWIVEKLVPLVENICISFLRPSISLLGHKFFIPQIGLTVLNQTSGSGDGNLLNISAVSWADCRAATSASEPVEVGCYAMSALQGSNNQIRRGFLPFDTSSLGGGATITVVTLDLYPTSSDDADNDGDDFISVVQCTVADPTLMVQGDFDQWGTTRAHETSEDKDITGITLNQTLTWTFNATGRGFVSLTGTTQLGIREGHDLKNTGPVAAGNTFILVNSSADALNKPTLNVTYTGGGAGDDFAYII